MTVHRNLNASESDVNKLLNEFCILGGIKEEITRNLFKVISDNYVGIFRKLAKNRYAYSIDERKKQGG